MRQAQSGRHLSVLGERLPLALYDAPGQPSATPLRCVCKNCANDERMSHGAR